MKAFPLYVSSIVCFLLYSPISHSAEIRIQAAASLAEVLKEVNAAFEKETGIVTRTNLGASSLLARQIQEGAPADLFFSADEKKMDLLQQGGLIRPASRTAVLSNSLVVILPRESPLHIAEVKDLTQPGIVRIATGDPNQVPVGVYAREYLTRAGLWQTLEPKVVRMENVRTALAAVEAGNAQAGIVYKTDAALSRKVRVAVEIPAADGPRIVYPVAILKEARDPHSAGIWLTWIRQAKAQAIFRKHGFPVLLPPGG